MTNNRHIQCKTILMLCFVPLPSFAGVTLSGMTDNYYGIVSDGRDSFGNSSEIKINMEKGFDAHKYGFSSTLMTRYSAVQPSISNGTAKTFAFVSGKWGAMYLGYNVGTAHILRSDNFKCGEYSNSTFLLHPTFLWEQDTRYQAQYIFTPGLWSDQLHFDTDLSTSTRFANKLTYVSPLILDHFLFGVSYIPDGDDYIKISNQTIKNRANFHNVIQVAASYRAQIKRVNLKTTIALEDGTHVINRLYDLRTQVGDKSNLSAWNWSAQLGYMGFNFGTSYGNTVKNMKYSSAEQESSGEYWSYGLAYSIANIAMAASYFHSTNTSGNLEKYSLITSYHCHKNITIYGELAQFHFTSQISKPYTSQEIGAAIMGLKVSF